MNRKACLLLIFVLLPVLTGAESTVDCHCFNNRSYNPQAKAAADPYFLATTQNSFMVLLYKLNKKDLVRAKMSGSKGEELWIQNELARQSELTVQAVAKLYQESGDWYSVIGQLKLDPEKFGTDFLAASNSSQQLAALIVDRQLISALNADLETLNRGRTAGMGNKELILSVLLSEKPVELFGRIKNGQETWGEALSAAGLFHGADINRRLHELMK